MHVSLSGGANIIAYLGHMENHMPQNDICCLLD